MKLARISMPLLAAALVLATPAFYLQLAPAPVWRHAGSALYALIALLAGLSLSLRGRPGRGARDHRAFDLVLMAGALASAWLPPGEWSVLEWVLRLGYCGAAFVRLVMLAASRLTVYKPLQILLLAAVTVGSSGAGFLWLEPQVTSYADGVWLAFTTAATVGYGDLVPTTPGARVLAVFIVLLGYALLSILTGSIAAVLVGEDEKRLRQAMHDELRMLRGDIAQLRAELREGRAGAQGPESRNG